MNFGDQFIKSYNNEIEEICKLAIMDFEKYYDTNISFIKTNDLILEKMEFKVCHKTSERNLFESEGSIEWDTIIFYPQNLKNKNGEFDIEIEIKNIFNYLIQENILSEELILPGLELNTEIWYGKEDLEIKSLSYTLLKN
jgi:hypothetical protein